MTPGQNKIIRQIQSKIKEIEEKNTNKTIIVLKGIPSFFVNLNGINLEKIHSNKFQYFLDEILNKNRKYLLYEEYLMLFEFVNSQYDSIKILINNLYINYYPVEQLYSDEIKNNLLNNYEETDDDSNDDLLEIGDIDSYKEIYSGLKEENGFLYGAYNDPEKINIKTTKINLFDNFTKTPERKAKSKDYHNITCEEEYLNFVSYLLNYDEQEINFKISDYTDENIDALNNRIQIIANYWSDLCDFNEIIDKNESKEYKQNPEFKKILKKYWGYDSFKTLKTYNMDLLSEEDVPIQDKKEIIEISQEQIISEIVEQVESCHENAKRENAGKYDAPEYRDIFVTAPTGAGKSVMFQIPAIYLAEKYNLLTIVISPLIGLMNDQVKSLEIKNCKYAKTINSDISPIIKNEITEKVADGEYHILYISPETLLSRSDVVDLIGNRTIGMIVIDEAHIVTTWGKQFRPDYWYLGDHIKKIRKNQLVSKGSPFIIASFTATAIYGGYEDMFRETINSLHMSNPIVHLGYVKRNDIKISVSKSKKDKNARSEYELDKIKEIEKLFIKSQMFNQKVLVYFPYVDLIERTRDYFASKKMISKIAKYHGAMSKDEKDENYEQFLNGEKKFMLATKAFGMGIDIPDIDIVAHYAPTGNVCDYVQEIGRVARDGKRIGEAKYVYDKRDFKYINRLHGLSSIKERQLIKVMSKIYDLYQESLAKNSFNLTRRRNAMLIDAENFSYIFKSPFDSDREDNSINKVKTALLLIQKDFENRYGFSPINIRPIPLFSIGYFKIEPKSKNALNRKYKNCIETISEEKQIYRVRLDKIWKKDYQSYSFPKFKYLIYSNSPDLKLNIDYKLVQALCVEINFDNDKLSSFRGKWKKLSAYVNKNSILIGKYIKDEDFVCAIKEIFKVNKYKANTISDILISSIQQYMKSSFNKEISRIFTLRNSENGNSYQFSEGIFQYFDWIEKGLNYIMVNLNGDEFYITSDKGNEAKKYNLILGVLEALDILTFKMIGGANSQLYIYINQTQRISNYINNPSSYKNGLLEKISNRHILSVKMLTYLYENDFTSEQMWELLENYFLGYIPEAVENAYKEEIEIKNKNN